MNHLIRVYGSVIALLAVFSAVAAQSTAPSTRPSGPERWEEAIAAFEAQDRVSPPEPGGILFVGSSSIRGWKLKEYFPGLAATNRGFGGSEIGDSLHFANRIILPYKPRAIVFYAGENDIVAGKKPEQVADNFRKLAALVRTNLPETRIIFIGLKPSPSRWKHVDTFRRTSGLIRTFVDAEPGMMFLDVEPHMLGQDGMPRPELYLKDQLHMTPAGYRLWTELLTPYLDGPATPTAPGK